MYGVMAAPPVASGVDLPVPPVGPRRRIAKLIDRHCWTTPRTVAEARKIWRGLERLERRAQDRHGRDRIARLFAVRLAVFRAHWPLPPEAERDVWRYRDDLAAMIEHDLPRLRRLLSGVDERKAAAGWFAACPPQNR